MSTGRLGDSSTLKSLFEDRCRTSRDRVAVAYGSDSVTYGDLDARAEKLAAFLRTECKVGPDVPVGVIANERTIGTIVSIVAIVKAGGAYLSLDRTMGQSRLAYIVENAQAAAILCGVGQGSEFEVPCPVLEVTEAGSMATEAPAVASPAEVTDTLLPSHLAYVIYTSGSTGKPKGVMAEHRGACACVRAYISVLGITEEDRIVQQTPLTFDVHVSEVWVAFVAGATLVLVSDTVRRFTLETALLEERCSIVNLTPTHLATLNPDVFENSALRLIVTSGEVLSEGIQQPWTAPRPGSMPSLVNAYGMTECNTCSLHHCDHSSPYPLSLGHPLPTMHYLLLDENLNPAAEGEIGELVIAGLQVGRGYVNAPELTAKAFVNNPWYNPEGEAVLASSPTMYRTGDLCRKLGDGTLECLGRRDHQVKVRGHRVELGEIEQCIISTISVVSQCVVVLHGDSSTKGQECLVAYVASPLAQTQKNVSDINARVAAALPRYMVPSAYVLLDSLPTNAHDKIDRKALPRPCPEAFVADAAVPTPEGSTDVHIEDASVDESIVALVLSALRKAMGRDELGPTDDFFTYGGNSVSALMTVRLLTEAGLSVRISDILAAPSARGIAAQVAVSQHDGPIPAAVAPAPSHSYSAVPLTADHAGAVCGLLQNYLESNPLSFHLPGDITASDLAKSVPRAIDRGQSLVAVDEIGRVVGCLSCEDLAETRPYTSNLPSSPITSLMEGLRSAFIERMAPVEPGQWLFHEVVCTSPGVVSAGLSLELLRMLHSRACQLAVEGGYRGCVAINTNAATIAFAEALGFTEVSRISYADFEYDGTHPLAGVKAPHVYAGVYCLEAHAGL